MDIAFLSRYQWRIVHMKKKQHAMSKINPIVGYMQCIFYYT